MNAPAFDFNRCLTTGRVVQVNDQFVVETPAAAFIQKIREVDDVIWKINLAHRALRHDPGCVQANCVLATYADSDEEAIEYLRAAVIAGDTLWTPIWREYGAKFDWMASQDSACYRQAMVELGEKLEAVGEPLEAIKFYRRALNLAETPAVKFNLEHLELGSPLRL